MHRLTVLAGAGAGVVTLGSRQAAADELPIAMGELFNNPHEWTPLITERVIDYIRLHVSQVGGLTPACKIAVLGEMYGVRTAWHGPDDVSPVGHCANLT